MNIVYDNIIFSLQRAGGISVYWYEMANKLINHSENISFIEQDNGGANIFRQILSIPTEHVITARRWPRLLTRYQNIETKLDPGTIFHSSYYRTHSDPQVVSVITVYDFIYEHYRAGVPRFIHHLQKKYAIQNADGIICISNSTKKDLLDHFPDTPADKIRTIHLSAATDYKRIGVPEEISPEFTDLLAKKVILFVGERSSYKNFNIAVETVLRLKDAVLVAVGGKPFAGDELTRVNMVLAGRFRFYPKLDNYRLNQLYNLAFCLLYPSSYEGFGIPALEAMQAGCPVVSTDCSALPEVCGDAGLMVAEISPQCFAGKIEQLANPEFRDAVVQRGLLQSERFSWDHTFRETIGFYHYIHEQKNGVQP